MNVTKDKVEGHQAYLTVQIEGPEMEKALDGAYRRLVQRARIPGFRKGKAPRAILERYLGKESLTEDAINHVVPELYEQALKEQGLEAAARPQLDVTQTDPTVIFKAVVPLKPTVALGDYRAIKVEQPHSDVTDKNVDDVIEELRRQHSTWEPVDRAVEFNDLVVMDVEASAEGKPFINQKGAQFQAVKGQSYPIPGFSEELIGLQKGDEKEFKLTLPADMTTKELAGKEAAVKVKVSEIKTEKLPEVDDDLAKAVNPEILTAQALRDTVRKEMTQRAEDRDKIDFEEKLVDAVATVSNIEFPTVLVESEIDRILNQRFQNNRQSLDNYLRAMNKTEQEIRDELRPSAVNGVKRALALAEVAREAKVEVTDADVDAEVDKMKSGSTAKKEDLDKFFKSASVRDSIRQTLHTRRTFELLANIAKENGPPEAPGAAEEPKAEKETKGGEAKEKRTRKKKEA